MKEKLFGTLSLIASVATGIISFCGVENKKSGIIISFIVFCLASLFSLFFLWLSYLKEKPKSLKKDDEKIDKYLENIYDSEGPIYIFSQGSLSWINYGRILQIFEKKANQNSLTIVVKNMNKNVRKLKPYNAHIYTYEQLGIRPFSSWSVVNPHGNDCILAFGKNINNRHFIKEYSYKDSDLLGVVKNLTDIIEEMNKENDRANSNNRK